MSEINQSVLEQSSGVFDRVAGLIDRTQNAGAVLLAGLAFGAVGTAAESFATIGEANAQTPSTLFEAHELATASRSPQQVEEYVRVIAKNAAGAAVTRPNHTFVFLEQCKDGSKTVSRSVIDNKDVQPLGNCNVGSKVTVTEEMSLSGAWQNKSPLRQRILKATRGNNHRFSFIEQEITPAPPTPQPTPPSPAIAPTPPANTQPSPSPTPTPTPTPTPNQTIEVNEIALDSSGATIPAPSNTFEYDWTCGGVDEGIVTLNSDPQVLGSCPEGEAVTITEETPLGSQKWTELSTNPQSFTVGSSTLEAVFKDQEVATSPPPGDPYSSGQVGVDISWPQCGQAAPTGADFGIVGVNDGLGYSTNPCLAAEAADFPSNKLSLYVNTGWNSSSAHATGNSPKVCVTGDENCFAYDYGYNAGLYAYDAALALGITSPTWWLDVETINTWSSDTGQNQNSLQGEYDALKASGATTVGSYSTTAQWDGLTGNWINDWPSWGATTWTTPTGAASYCTGHEFTGGSSYLMQFTPTPELDQDYAC